MIAEVASYFPGALRPGLPWPLFLLFYRRSQMFEARAELRARVGTGGAIDMAFGGDTFSSQELLRRAYPLADTAIGQMIENLASRKRQESADG